MNCGREHTTAVRECLMPALAGALADRGYTAESALCVTLGLSVEEELWEHLSGALDYLETTGQHEGTLDVR
jgi:hypothetical protein